MIQNFGLKTRLIGTFAILSLALLSVGAFSYRALNRVIDSYSHVAETNLPNAMSLANLQSDQKDVALAVTELTGFSSTAETTAVNRARMQKAVDDYDKSTKAYLSVDFVE